MAKIPHSSYKETYQKLKEDERHVGPGAYHIDDFLTEADKRPRCNRGALDQLTPRFPVDLPVWKNSCIFFSSLFIIGQSTTAWLLRCSG